MPSNPPLHSFPLIRKSAEREKRKLSVTDLAQNVKDTMRSPRKRIKIGPQTYDVPTVLFAKRSLYFKAMFDGNYAEANSQDAIEVKIQHPEVMDIAVDYLLTGAVPSEQVTKRNLFNLLTTSQFLQLPKLESVLMEIIKDSIAECLGCEANPCECVKDLSYFGEMPGLGELDQRTFVDILDSPRFPFSEKILLAAKWMEKSKDLSAFKTIINSDNLWKLEDWYTEPECEHIYDAFKICARHIPEEFFMKMMKLGRMQTHRSEVYSLWLADNKSDEEVLKMVSKLAGSRDLDPQEATDILEMRLSKLLESGDVEAMKKFFSASMVSFMKLTRDTHSALDFLDRDKCGEDSRRPTKLMDRLYAVRACFKSDNSDESSDEEF